MSLLKLTWQQAADSFQTRTVIGDPRSIFELWHNLCHGSFSDGVAPKAIAITNLDGVPVDPTKGMAELHCMATELHYGDD
jgi:hypothetical protein